MKDGLENDEKPQPDMNERIRRTLAARQRAVMAAHQNLARALGLNTKTHDNATPERSSSDLTTPNSSSGLTIAIVKVLDNGGGHQNLWG